MVAMKILGNHPGPSWFCDEALKSREGLGLARKVNVQTDEHVEEQFHSPIQKLVSTVVITTKSGEELEAYAELVMGKPENHLTIDEILEKFRSLASKILEKKQTEKILRIVDLLERLDDV